MVAPFNRPYGQGKRHMGNQIYIKDTTLSIHNGKIDGVRRYGIATINGRTYSKIHALDISSSEGDYQIGLQHGLAFTNLDGLIATIRRRIKVSDAKVVNGEDPLNMDDFYQFIVDMFVGGYSSELSRLRATSKVCVVSGKKTFLWTLSSNYVTKRDGEIITGEIDKREMSNFFFCNHGGKRYDQRHFDFRRHNGDFYLKENFDKLFSPCRVCLTDVNSEIYNPCIDGRYICSDCDHNIISPIRRYGHKPSLLTWDVLNGSIVKKPLRTSDKRDFLGFELEVQFIKNVTNFDIKRICDKINDILEGGFLFCVNDSSITGNGRIGVEIVSHPMTFEFFQSYGFETLLKLKGEIDGDDVSKSCGIHVHLNRSTLSTLNQYKIAKFVNTWRGFVFKLSERNRSDLRTWANFNRNISSLVSETFVNRFRKYKREQITDWKSLKTIGISNDRYSATNFNNSHTLELRMFKSTMNETAFRKNIEFAESMRDWARVSDLTTFNNFKKYWSHVEKSGKYENLVTWVKSQSWGESWLSFPSQRSEI